MKTVRLKAQAMRELRFEVFRRDGWKCVDCGVPVRWDGIGAGHLAHIRSRGAGGSDTLSNTRLLCSACHRGEHNGGKIIPGK